MDQDSDPKSSSKSSVIPKKKAAEFQMFPG